MNTALTTAVIPLAALFIVYRQMMTRPTERPGILYVSLVLIALGVAQGGVVDPQHLGVSVALVTVELFAAVAFGVIRAYTVRIWRDAKGVTWSKATPWTLLAWVVSVGSRVGLYFLSAAFGLALSAGSLLVFIGVTIGVQAVLVMYRGRTHSGAPALV